MAFRWSATPFGIRQAIFPRLEYSAYRTTTLNAFAWTRRTHTATSFPARIPQQGAKSARRYLWLVPVAGGLALYLSPQPRSLIRDLLSSPTIIPCNGPRRHPELIIQSPAEPHRSIISQITAFLRDHVLEPILTARRLVHLLFLFIPVLLTSPMLLVGKPEKELEGDRWGAVWWYEFLTLQMQRAGPTFVKVRA